MKKFYLLFILSIFSVKIIANNTGAFGTVTMDGKIWNQLAFHPEIPIGKFGLALDLVFYFDENGNLHKDEWDFSDGNSIKNTLIDKIYYLRYGFPDDQVYGKIGALDEVSLGYEILVGGYANSIEYPQVRKVGLDFRFKSGLYSYHGFVNDFKENLGVVGIRMQTNALLAFPVGFTIVRDRNQYLGLKDKDKDGIPDFVDDFPENENFWLDSDQDGYADNDFQHEFDRDGDGLPDVPGDTLSINNFWDNLGNNVGAEFENETFYDSLPDNEVLLKPEPLNINQDGDPVSAIAIDLGYPFIEKDNFSLILYAQFAKMFGETINPENDSTVSLGSGKTAVKIACGHNHTIVLLNDACA